MSDVCTKSTVPMCMAGILVDTCRRRTEANTTFYVVPVITVSMAVSHAAMVHKNRTPDGYLFGHSVSVD